MRAASKLIDKFRVRKKILQFPKIHEPALVAEEEGFDYDLSALPVDEMDGFDQI